MALVLPHQPVTTASSAELRLRSLLGSLPDNWRVLHSVAWQSLRSGRQSDGEADFVVVIPDAGLLVVEVKGGRLRLHEGQWYSTDRDGIEHSVKDPYRQAVDSKHALARFLHERFPNLRLGLGHAVAFPDAEAVRLGPDAPTEITWDRTRLGDMRQAIREAVEHWQMHSALRPSDIDAISSALLPSTAVNPMLRHQIADAEEALARLTDEQVRVLEGLRRNRRAIIYGGAGTGKSVLAVHRALRFAEQGAKVLLTCFNQPLAEHFSLMLNGHGGIRVCHFHGLCTEMSKEADLLAYDPDPLWLSEHLPAQLPTACARTDQYFDAVVVDEGQDFKPAWWLALQMAMADPDESPLYVFADTLQAIYCDGWEPPFTEPSFDLTVNCRNTIQIAASVATLAGSNGASLGVEGPSPTFAPVDTFKQVGERLKQALNRLLNSEDIAAQDIAVLSTSKAVVNQCRAMTFGAGLTFGPPGKASIVAETVHRFKGLESPAVILVVEPGSFYDTPLLYIGISRARSYLEVIGPPALGAQLRLSST